MKLSIKQFTYSKSCRKKNVNTISVSFFQRDGSKNINRNKKPVVWDIVIIFFLLRIHQWSVIFSSLSKKLSTLLNVFLTFDKKKTKIVLLKLMQLQVQIIHLINQKSRWININSLYSANITHFCIQNTEVYINVDLLKQT